MDNRPYICRKLKEMREGGEPVYLTIEGKRYRCSELKDGEWPGGDRGWFLISNRGRYDVAYIIQERWNALVHGPKRRFYISYDKILASLELLGERINNKDKNNKEIGL